MSSFNKINSFVAAVANKVHNLGSDSLKVALTNSSPVATNTQLSNITEISYTNLSSRAITTTSSTQTSGTYKLVLTDLVLTASGAVGPFRYVVIYNDTATNKELICWFDLGAAWTTSNTMQSGDVLTIDFDASTGVLTLA